MGGPGLERVWNGYGTGSRTKRSTPQHCHQVAHLYQNWQFGAGTTQQIIIKLPAGSSQVHPYHHTTK